MQGDIKPSRCIPNNDSVSKAQRNITDFLKALITTDSIKIFSITCCTLVTVYLENSKRHFKNNIIVLYITTFYMQHCAVAQFLLKQYQSVIIYL